MEEFIIPDSPNWSFSNSSNVSCVSSSHLIYASCKKIVLCSLETGKAKNLIFTNKDVSISGIACNGIQISAVCSDAYVRIYSLQTLQELEKIRADGCLGIKFWGNDIVCVFKTCYKLYREFKEIQEGTIDGFCCVKTYDEYLGIVQKDRVFISTFLLSFNVEGKFTEMSMEKFSQLQLLLLSQTCVKVYHGSQEICEIPLKKSQNKLKSPVLSSAWLKSNLFIYSTAAGEIILVQVSPLITQSFMNNPHTKAILSLHKTNFGTVSLGMDRYVCMWEISEVDVTENAPRSYSKTLAYTEPVWEFQALEGSVCSLAVNQEKLIVTCGKPCMLIYDINSNNLHGRSIWKPISSEVLHISIGSNPDVLVLTCTSELNVLSINQEKSLASLKKSFCKAIWKDSTNIIAWHKGEVLTWNYLTAETHTLINIDLEIKVVLIQENSLYIGTQEGNILRFTGKSMDYISIIHNRSINCFSLGDYLAAGSDDGSISIHKDPVLVLEKHYRAVLCVIWIGSIIASASLDHSIQTWDSITGAALGNYRLHQGAIRSCLQNPNYANFLITGSDDQTIRLWSLIQPAMSNKPIKLPNSKKSTEGCKTLFPSLHKFIYQQNKEQSLLSLHSLIDNNINLEMNIFRITQESAKAIIEIYECVETKFWKKAMEIQHGEGNIEIEEEWEELSLFAGEENVNKWAKKKAEEALLKRKIHKCVVWLLIGKEVNRAMWVYVEQRMFIEAVVVAGLFGVPTEGLYRDWAKRLIDTAKVEQGIKCYVGIRDFSKSVEVLTKFNDKGGYDEIIKKLESLNKQIP